MKKLLILFIFCLLICTPSYSKERIGKLSLLIKNSGIPTSSISISVKNTDTGKILFSQNDKILMHPASVQKLLTIIPAADILGEDYNFETSLYSRGEESYLLKLSGDPYLKTKELQDLVSSINEKKVKKIYIDDSAIEKKMWGEGWQWDDDLNPLMPKYNSYNLDSNLMKITVVSSEKNNGVIILNQNKVPVIFINNVKKGEINNISVQRNAENLKNTIELSGTVKSAQTITIPISNPQLYFNFKLTNALENRNIYLKEYFSVSSYKPSDKFIKSIKRPISEVISDILENSNNMASEILLKTASAKKYNITGTDIAGIKLFHEYCKKIGIDSSGIRLTDASGVSKNNLVTTDFITEYLIKNKDTNVVKYMAKPEKGTLSQRLLPLKDKLRAKTGTLSDISSLAGYLETKKGNHYSFAIIINDPKSSSSDKKVLEDYFVRELYLNY